MTDSNPRPLEDSEFSPIRVSPYATNVLDLVGREDLVTRSGIPVTVRRDMYGFFILDIGKLHLETPDNLEASFILNSHETGAKRS